MGRSYFDGRDLEPLVRSRVWVPGRWRLSPPSRTTTTTRSRSRDGHTRCVRGNYPCGVACHDIIIQEWRVNASADDSSVRVASGSTLPCRSVVHRRDSNYRESGKSLADALVVAHAQKPWSVFARNVLRVRLQGYHDGIKRKAVNKKS